MRKKLLYFLLAIVCLIGGIWFYSAKYGSHSFSSENCPFCKTSVLDYQKFYEDDLVLALYCYRPVMQGHCLVIPKRHVERFGMLSDAEADRLFQVIKKVNVAAEKAFGASSYVLLQKNGREAGQSVPHVHFHYIPRKRGDDSMIKFFYRLFLVNVQKPIEPNEMHQAVEKMKAAMREL